eukprot:TRINITY_DN1745_c0_g1_i2.p1 TRINITY_DN1745_c0_g1~~TRINITY_DN1745_c0_g1_i2.p1  ORF type:complete len:560 (+),score=88.12 TRINITY_DN1745_c0_g1_i2:95-1774(+)
MWCSKCASCGYCSHIENCPPHQWQRSDSHSRCTACKDIPDRWCNKCEACGLCEGQETRVSDGQCRHTWVRHNQNKKIRRCLDCNRRIDVWCATCKECGFCAGIAKDIDDPDFKLLQKIEHFRKQAKMLRENEHKIKPERKKEEEEEEEIREERSVRIFVKRKSKAKVMTIHQWSETYVWHEFCDAVIKLFPELTSNSWDLRFYRVLEDESLPSPKITKLVQFEPDDVVKVYVLGEDAEVGERLKIYEAHKKNGNENEKTQKSEKKEEKEEQEETEELEEDEPKEIKVPDWLPDEAKGRWIAMQLAKREQREKERKIRTQTYECSICCCDATAAEMYIIDKCFHRFCRDCMEGYLTSKIRSKDFSEAYETTTATKAKGYIDIKRIKVVGILCPERGCETILEYQEVKHLLDERTFTQYDTFLRDREIDKDKNMMWCRTPGCGNAMVLNKAMYPMYICYKCLGSWCLACDIPWHGDLTCKQWKDFLALEKHKKDYDVKDFVMFQRWLKNHAQECPNCKSAIEKNGGCNHMTCANCGHEFCWLCLARYTHSHFSDTKCDQFS